MLDYNQWIGCCIFLLLVSLLQLLCGPNVPSGSGIVAGAATRNSWWLASTDLVFEHGATVFCAVPRRFAALWVIERTTTCAAIGINVANFWVVKLVENCLRCCGRASLVRGRAEESDVPLLIAMMLILPEKLWQRAVSNLSPRICGSKLGYSCWINGYGVQQLNSKLEFLEYNGSTAAAGGLGSLPAVAISWSCHCRLPGTPDDTWVWTAVGSCLMRREAWPLILL
ncbi:hypothetical protein Nepgr_006708 [Nepenthes gracilis]|uniref:Secreted protein n=1 Tax=Nepenthes gracilis TaxID=150966 RepID=A0AAD3S5N5_NEPGR|nr:hypothetical protein Nepgr_006708 [Nepenthes gracilis]